jgi:hypothetical protein
MNPSQRWMVASAAALAFLAGRPADGQERSEDVCRGEEAVTECFNRRVNQREASAALGREVAAARTAERRDLNAKATGANVAAQGPESAIRDFLPRLAGALLTPGLTEDPSALDLRLNLPLSRVLPSTLGATLQAGMTVHKPELFGALVDSIPESIREASRTRLSEGLGDLDDMTLFGALNFEGRSVGRAFRPHRTEVDRLAGAVIQGVDAGSEAFTTARSQYVAVRDAITVASLDPARRSSPECRAAIVNEAAGTLRLGQLRTDCLKASVRLQLERALAPAAEMQARRQQLAADALRSSGFTRISQLINNQPQLNTTVEYRSRAGVVGPEELTGKLRFEMGFANMNALRRHCQGTGVTPACLQAYLARPGVKRSISRGDRLWLAGDLNRRPDFDLALPSDSVRLRLGASTTMALSGGYGAYFGDPDDGESRDRLDLQVRYDFTRNDELRQDRFVSTVLYTLRLSDQSSGVFGLTWANKPEFVGDVDRKLGANLGVTYKLNRNEEAEGGAE